MFIVERIQKFLSSMSSGMSPHTYTHAAPNGAKCGPGSFLYTSRAYGAEEQVLK